ncbi:unnamed protein product [Darwinula stevensoni]|uniref:Bardet-Biedl syndrome 7 protein homolog n=1 Tax=Darwinula stevensoni TaxID=69355 RepID=A0A7R9A6F4_9CRUS|nr:unnamed protein product [Darwinula stevensoni]CAG0887645.1 unnamed protein product [Darwinula stevensoni]
MELSLTRVDYAHVSLTHRGTMRLLPEDGEKNQQKVAIGDSNGVLQVFGMKRTEPVLLFKTIPGDKIRCLELAGAPGALQDKIFISAGSTVRAYTKKGKQFLGFDTNFSEDIRVMKVVGTHLLVGANYVYTQYDDCVETNHYLAKDEILDIVCLPLEKTEGLRPVLACADRTLRVLKGSNLLYEVGLEGRPTCLTLAGGDGGDSGENVLYGTQEGHIGMVSINKQCAILQWTIWDENHYGSVNCMDHYDLTGDGVKELIVGRDDGSIEVYSYEEGEKPVLKCSHMAGESITSVQGGVIGSTEGYREIVAATFSGKVFGLSTCSPNLLYSRMSGDSNEMEKHITALRAELEDLQAKVAREREKYQQATQSTTSGISAVPFFSIHDKMILNKDEASYILSLEVETPIEIVLLQSDIPVDILDVEKNSAVVSFSHCDPESGNYMLATYRCQANTTRLEVKIRSIEGQYGSIKAYVIPRLQPKTSQVREYQIKPLSLHTRIHEFDQNRPYNVLRLKGDFSFAMVHSWVAFCLPEVPQRTPAADEIVYIFTSTFLDTMLECRLKEHEAQFKSDNVSTISILKDVISKEATKNKTKLDIACDVCEESVSHTLHLLHPKLEEHLILAKKVQLIDGLREVVMNEGSHDSLSPEYQDILAHADELLALFHKQPCYLERLYGMITDLYIDKFKFQGINVKGRVPQLLEILDNYNLDRLVSFFHQDD